MKILAFETSCDETSVAIVEDFNVIVNYTRQQLVHSEFGGVVPELAAREHIRYIYQLTKLALKEVSLSEIEGIAFTYGPGLASSLLIGITFGKTISQLINKPFIGINHLEGHIFSIFINNKVDFPFLCLIVSGGHTELVLVEDFLKYKVIGYTLDDAIGEAFDKGAKMLNLGYPGGPTIDKLSKSGNKDFIKFPKPKIKSGKFNFSFSGIKTSLRLYLKDKSEEFIKEHISDICASYQEALIDTVLDTTLKAIKEYNISRICVVAGVSLNSRLREKFKEQIDEVYFPLPEYCMDNAAMIGVAGAYRLKKGYRSNLDISAEPNLEL
ncbi:MAG: tRNA (adenosine(37)-N6)-threonylcarbamoyltransferase complex transferase subunit TsaD [candidate division WOR-3 bacterium]|nr:tRNA (adenosine(37)-N6)-threonylcarbamoyltransferase complex transferase subunit TsaD [candidate division WOR-3 bacterium]MCX7947959.1 tRNA (adenosine(37)-N6)-threonylcarbamoyltransferase complex transferase subunit TsaD [candidate division WOR-3 bacterium]MDW8150903.1 tRNA (adenosine(37)-N6)-threonylcarbamoyltransferase complex transferase subunit TsaD [candidate division WOR-3 bacterium]